MTAVTARDALRRAGPLLELRPILVVSDFDGTLSPIVLDPWGALMLPLARRALRRLAGAPGVHVAILSGRGAADVAERVRIGGARYLGNHGVESGRLARRQRAGTLTIEVVTVAQHLADAAERLATELPLSIPEPWLVVERKPPAVAFHFRGAPDVDAAGVRGRHLALPLGQAGHVLANEVPDGGMAHRLVQIRTRVAGIRRGGRGDTRDRPCAAF